MHRRRFVRWFCVFLALSLAGDLRTGSRDARADEPTVLRVLSYNIHHGEGVDGKLDLERIARVILSVQPDVVSLQEVDRGATRTKRVDQPAELARLTKMHVVFGENIPLQGGEYGNAILSRFPIERHRNHRLPNYEQGEQRGVLEAEITVPGWKTPLVLYATHFDHRPADRERVDSAKRVNELAKERAGRLLLLAGDLNDGPDSPALRELAGGWTRANERPAPTIPVDRPRTQIDFVLSSPRERWTTRRFEVLDEAVASDHRAVLAELSVTPQ